MILNITSIISDSTFIYILKGTVCRIEEQNYRTFIPNFMISG